MFDFAIVGNGLIGAAAARYLSEIGANIAVIGPPEPQDKTAHQGVFASHYDSGRVMRILERDASWSWLSQRAAEQYQALEQQTGKHLLTQTGVLYAAPPNGLPSYRQHAQEMADHAEIVLQDNPSAHGYSLPVNASTFLEGAPAGHINPRTLIQAQNQVTNATFFADTVVDTHYPKNGAVLTLASGETIFARKVILTTGAFTNFNQLLPEPIDLRLKSETIILAKVHADDTATLAQLPALLYGIQNSELDDVYVVPPVQFPDGNYYLKLGANTRHDVWFDDLTSVQRWFHHGQSDHSLLAMKAVVTDLLPDVHWQSFQTDRCIVCYTPSRSPYIDALIPDCLYLAVGGNGGGAKISDSFGWLAARLAAFGEWPAHIPHPPFAVQQRRRFSS